MPFVIGPSRNKTLQLAWAMLRASDRAEKKEKPEVAKAGASKPKSSLSRRTTSKKVARTSDEPKLDYPKESVLRSEPYLRLVAARPCKNCGRPKHSQAAHVPPSGRGIKRDDRETFPLCTDGPQAGRVGCHTKFDKWELMPRAAAVKQGERWAAQTRAEIEAEGAWPKRLPKWKAGKK